MYKKNKTTPFIGHDQSLTCYLPNKTALLALSLALQAKACVDRVPSSVKKLYNATKQKAAVQTKLKEQKTTPKITNRINTEHFEKKITAAIESGNFEELNVIFEQLESISSATSLPHTDNDRNIREQLYKLNLIIKRLKHKYGNGKVAEKLSLFSKKIAHLFSIQSLYEAAYKHKKNTFQKLFNKLTESPKEEVVYKLLKKDQYGYSVFASAYRSKYVNKNINMSKFMLDLTKNFLETKHFMAILDEMEEMVQEKKISTTEIFKFCALLSDYTKEEAEEKRKKVFDTYAEEKEQPSPKVSPEYFQGAMKTYVEDIYTLGVSEEVSKQYILEVLRKNHKLVNFERLDNVANLEELIEKLDQNENAKVVDELNTLCILLKIAQGYMEEIPLDDYSKEQVIDATINRLNQRFCITYKEQALRRVIENLYSSVNECYSDDDEWDDECDSGDNE